MSAKNSRQLNNNPFDIGLEGLKLFYNRARSVFLFAILMWLVSSGFLLLFVLGVSRVYRIMQYSNIPFSRFEVEVLYFWQLTFYTLSGKSTVGAILLLSVLALAALVVYFLSRAVFDYTSAKIMTDKSVSLTQAIKAVQPTIFSYVWLRIIVAVKVFLWSLLFFIPGVIMAVRYSLAGVSFYADNKRGKSAIRHSLALTKGAWLTTFAANYLWNFITSGLVPGIVQIATNTVLHAQLTTNKRNKTQPKAHLLSWITLIVPLSFVVLSMMLGLVLSALLFMLELDVIDLD